MRIVGDALLKLGRAEEALAYFKKSFEWVRVKQEMEPNNARAARDQSQLLRSIGAAQLALGQTGQGALLLNEANAARAKLAAESGTPSPVPPKD